VALLDRAFQLAVAVQPLRDRMRSAHVHDIATAEGQRVITSDEAAQLKTAADAAAAVIAVDDFAPEELSPRDAWKRGDVSSPAKSWPPATAAE
jgi:acyl-CoA dehydrogenase